MKTRPVAAIKIFIMLLATTLSSFSNAMDIVARSYDIKNVDEVVVHGGGSLELIQGDSESLRVEAENDIMERVVIDQSGGKLTLSIKNLRSGFDFFHWFDSDDDKAKYILQLKSLKYLSVNGASHATLGNWSGKDLEVKASGAAEVTFVNLKLQNLFIELSGASNSRFQQLSADKANFNLSGAANMDVKAAGQVKFLKVDASGASNFRGKLLTAVQANVEASGASNIDLKAMEHLKAGASGASNIHYLGQAELQSNASGASHINSIKE
jgi:hypothetical protein